MAEFCEHCRDVVPNGCILAACPFRMLADHPATRYNRPVEQEFIDNLRLGISPMIEFTPKGTSVVSGPWERFVNKPITRYASPHQSAVVEANIMAERPSHSWSEEVIKTDGVHALISILTYTEGGARRYFLKIIDPHDGEASVEIEIEDAKNLASALLKLKP